MTKKDYIAIAKIFNATEKLMGDTLPCKISPYETYHYIRNEMRRLFTSDNPLYNDYKFIKACESR